MQTNRDKYRQESSYHKGLEYMVRRLADEVGAAGDRRRAQPDQREDARHHRDHGLDHGSSGLHWQGRG